MVEIKNIEEYLIFNLDLWILKFLKILEIKIKQSYIDFKIELKLILKYTILNLRIKFKNLKTIY